MANFVPLGSRNRWGQIFFAVTLGAVSGYYLWKEPLEKHFREQRDSTVGSEKRENGESS